MMSAGPWASLPLRPGAGEDFDRVRGFLRQAHFNDATLCRLLGMGDMSDLGLVRWEAVDRDALGPALEWCIRVFLRGSHVTRSESLACCGEEVLNSLLTLGLLHPAPDDASRMFCPVWVYPVDGFVVVSDRRDNPTGGVAEPAADVVFPAIYVGTIRFLSLLPVASSGEALDLCGGSGIGALHHSRTARTAASADVTERSTRFAEFSARLNGVALESLCGDLYEPVRGRQFDVITAHPPFVPATGERMIYRDAGEAGEEITQRIITGLPDHLRPGGICLILCVARDTDEGAFEHRAPAWLGSAAGQFDIVYGLEKVLSVEEVVERLRKGGHGLGPEQARSLTERLRSLQTKQFVYGALYLQRCEPPVTQPPLRLQMAREAVAADFQRVLAWRRHARQAGFQDWLADSRPRLASALELTARHVVSQGSLVPVEWVFSIDKELPAALRPDAWIVPLIARLEGDRSVREVFQSAWEQEELPRGFALGDFCELIERMVARGFLEVDFPASLSAGSLNQ